MITLAFDTATPRPSLAVLGHDGVAVEHNLGEVPGGGRRVLEAIHEILEQSSTRVEDLGRIVVGVGPGGFTGIRIGIATALGLGHAAGVDVVGASSLEALALSLRDQRPGATILAPAIDARRREVFGAIYRSDGRDLAVLQEPAAMAPADFRRAFERAGAPDEVAIGGSGVRAFGDAFSGLGRMDAGPGGHNHPRAVGLISRVDAGAGVPARPVYCRLPDAEENRRRREKEQGR